MEEEPEAERRWVLVGAIEKTSVGWAVTGVNAVVLWGCCVQRWLTDRFRACGR